MIAFAHHRADATWQLAVDEYLLETQSNEGALRTYQWDKTSITFGYNLSYQEVVNCLGSVPRSPIRRLTAGGLVNHQNDYTFSIVIPKKNPFYDLTAKQSYQSIHRTIQAILKNLGVETILHPCVHCEDPRPSEASVNSCFENPVAFDLVRQGSIYQKVLGSAQKRTRKALLLQGTLDKKALPEVDWGIFEKRFLRTFSQKFSVELALQPLPGEEFLKQFLLKYRSNQWNQKR